MSKVTLQGKVEQFANPKDGLCLNIFRDGKYYDCILPDDIKECESNEILGFKNGDKLKITIEKESKMNKPKIIPTVAIHEDKNKTSTKLALTVVDFKWFRELVENNVEGGWAIDWYEVYQGLKGK